MSIFEAVKQSVTTRQAAKHFGIRAGRNGMCRCPFHADRNPSMKVDRRYYCFGCGATGDVIDFVSRLEGISPKEAALLLARAFSVPYPYVWGGSSPSTSFDCSGFVSYVLTNSGLCNTGRLGAQGLYNISTPVSDPQPGDLVFFVGTYDTSGVSHVGIYVGDGMMLHCGDPIQYSNLNTSYWQSHFYAYGRPPYN